MEKSALAERAAYIYITLRYKQETLDDLRRRDDECRIAPIPSGTFGPAPNIVTSESKRQARRTDLEISTMTSIQRWLGEASRLLAANEADLYDMALNEMNSELREQHGAD
jgi:hypothetical protein